MPVSLAGKVAVVTGSTAGIGLAIARRLAVGGANVVVSSRHEQNVDEAVAQLSAEGLSVTGCRCHVSNPEHRQQLVATAVEKFGGLDILVSNAATNPVFGGLLKCPEPGWNKVFDVNVKSALMLSKLVVPLMQERDGGSIVFISSIVGSIPNKMLGAYSVSKAALNAVTKVLSQECAEKGIRVNAIAPGFIDTKFSSALSQHPETRQRIEKSTCMNRIGSADEVAGMAAFLCSDEASYITGSVMPVDGGFGDLWAGV